MPVARDGGPEGPRDAAPRGRLGPTRRDREGDSGAGPSPPSRRLRLPLPEEPGDVVRRGGSVLSLPRPPRALGPRPRPARARGQGDAAPDPSGGPGVDSPRWTESQGPGTLLGARASPPPPVDGDGGRRGQGGEARPVLSGPAGRTRPLSCALLPWPRGRRFCVVRKGLSVRARGCCLTAWGRERAGREVWCADSAFLGRPPARPPRRS